MNQKGSVVVWIASVMPVIIIATAIMINVGGWEVEKISLQRAADQTARAALHSYQHFTPLPGDGSPWQKKRDVGSDQAIAMAAANVPANHTLNVEMVPGILVSSNPAIKVTISKSVSVVFIRDYAPVTISVTSIAELVSTSHGDCNESDPFNPPVSYLNCHPQTVR